MNEEFYMYRCLELAAKAAGHVAPNPMVGAILVYEDRIIGEGYHEKFGKAHAEVNCINDAIRKGNKDLIASAVLYVSLEPCAHFGKTPPCSDLIISYRIPKVVIGCRDPFEAVNGKGIERLQLAGVAVTVGLLEEECRSLNKRFFTFQKKKRPYIILKWAQTTDGIIAGEGDERLLISNEYTNRLVHKWRSEEASILAGTNTVLKDNPRLNTRFWPVSVPSRVVPDMKLRLPGNLNIFDNTQKTIIINTSKETTEGNIVYLKINKDKKINPQLIELLWQQNIQSVLVEGGRQLLQSFINTGCWDEIRVIQNMSKVAGSGLLAPQLPENIFKQSEMLVGSDRITFYNRSNKVC